MLGLVTEGSQPCQETLGIIRMLGLATQGFQHHGLSSFASSCTKHGYQNCEKPIKNNTELQAWSAQGYQPLKHTHKGMHCMPRMVT